MVGIREKNIVKFNISYIHSEELKAFRPLFRKYCGKPKEFPRGTILNTSGAYDSPMYYLTSGMVKIYTVNHGGYVRILGYQQRDTLTAMDRICDDEPAIVTAEALTKVSAIPVIWKDLTAMSQEVPSLMPALLKYYGKIPRLMCYDAEVKSIDDVSTRLASFLCMYTSALQSGLPTEVKMTQDELASAVNASRVQIARICSSFQKQGLIEKQRGRITVINRKNLMEISLGKKTDEH